MVDTARSWGKAIQDAAKNILNDPDNAFAFIDQGKFFPGDTPADPVEAGEYVEKSMLAAALSAVWVTGDPSKHAPPVIVTSDGVPQDGSGCDSYKPEDWDEGDLTFEDDVLDGARACVGDTAYWLMGARQGGNEGTCLVPGTSFPSQCPDKGILLEPLYNIDKLGDFGLSLDEVVGKSTRKHRPSAVATLRYSPNILTIDPQVTPSIHGLQMATRTAGIRCSWPRPKAKRSAS